MRRSWSRSRRLAAAAKATLVFYFKSKGTLASPPTPEPDGAAAPEFQAHPLPARLGSLSGLVSDFGRGVRGARGAEEGSAAAASAEAEAVGKLHALHAALIQPIAELLPPPAAATDSSAPRLIFILHDELCRVPFGALMGAAAEAQPLLAGYEVQVCNSLQVLKLMLEHAAAATADLAPAGVGVTGGRLPCVRPAGGPAAVGARRHPDQEAPRAAA